MSVQLTGSVVANAAVSAFRQALVPNVASYSGQTPDATGTSDASGNFTLTVSTPGIYLVQAIVGGVTTWYEMDSQLPAVAAVVDPTDVHLAGAETITGVKTFGANPVMGAGALPEADIASLATDLTARALDSAVIHLAGAETVTGAKRFTGQVLESPLAPVLVTAFNGGGQASATPLPGMFNRVGTSVATTAPFDSVLLPASSPGLDIVVVNATANPIQTFGTGTDTINGVAAATGITQPPNSVESYFCTAAGSWNADPAIGFSGQLFTELTLSATPFSGGGQASATQLAAQTNRISASVATAAPFDSVKLPASAPGLEVSIINLSANPIAIFGAGTDTINGVATATGIVMPQNSVEIFFSPVAGQWVVDPAIGFAGGLFTELSQDNIIAVGTTQGTGYAIYAQTNRVNTAAAATAPFNGVVLPASAAGLELLVINHAPNSIQVYGSGTDTIDDIANTVGVTQMVNSFVIYSAAGGGKWYSNGIGTGFSGQFPTVSFLNGLTAFAGGGQASGTLIQNVINRVTTVATAADSVKLPVSAGGMQITVSNAAANSLNVFPNTGDAINGQAVNTAFAIAATKTAQFSSAVAGQWHAVLSA